MTKSFTLWCALALGLGAAACTTATQPPPQVPKVDTAQLQAPNTVQQPTQGTQGTLGRTSPTFVEPPYCPGDTQDQVYTYAQSPQPRCLDIFSD